MPLQQPISQTRSSHWVVRWGPGQWITVALSWLFVSMCIGFAVWILTTESAFLSRQKEKVEGENMLSAVLLACVFFANGLLALLPATGFNSPTSLDLVQNQDGWELVLSRRLRKPVTQPLRCLGHDFDGEFIGLQEVQPLAFTFRCLQGGATAGFLTASPGWLLVFDINGEVVRWFISLADADGFLLELTRVCGEARYTRIHNVLLEMCSWRCSTGMDLSNRS